MVSRSKKAKPERGVLSTLAHSPEEVKLLQEIEETIGVDADFPESRRLKLLGSIRGFLLALKLDDLNYIRRDS
ncbi:hypothetical protein [Pseudomonas sp. 5Ae-yellow]|uniref:hypothetical protein n=1 Tax=Pseudomonas sp. 5Ae-yellow TaxID=2759848 RepID=UPI0015F423C3|nr:hypothetical protein [Pseudomonas sp. 5Ae-yellow]MBA6420995.1 hypothetical protein [Pseudomonas sp. 5Ae-yellow]